MFEIFLIITAIISAACAYSFYLKNKELEEFIEAHQSHADMQDETILRILKREQALRASIKQEEDS